LKSNEEEELEGRAPQASSRKRQEEAPHQVTLQELRKKGGGDCFRSGGKIAELKGN